MFKSSISITDLTSIHWVPGIIPYPQATTTDTVDDIKPLI